eukprot:jgi/Ulvmu1/4137/UM019_0116.1
MARPELVQTIAKVLANVGFTGVALGTGVSLAYSALFTVDGGERAVMFDRFQGVLDEVYGEGTWPMIPWVQKPQILDIRTRPRVISSVTGTGDLQMVNLSLRVLSRPDKTQLPWIVKNLGADWDERVLPSIGSEVVKAVVAQYNAESLLTKREEVSQAVSDSLRHRAEDFNIILDDVSITHLSFSGEFTKAVESKQVAEQDAQRAQFVVMKAEQERLAAVIKAEGESEAARLISEATKSFGFGMIELRRIEAAKEIAGTLAKGRNVTYLPNTGNMLFNMQ